MWWIALALAAPAPFDVKADYIGLAKQHCAREWPEDFRMQTHCMDGQISGMLQFKDASDRLGQNGQKALEICTEEWAAGGLPDWQMIGHCAIEQLRSFLALQRP